MTTVRFPKPLELLKTRELLFCRFRALKTEIFHLGRSLSWCVFQIKSSAGSRLEDVMLTDMSSQLSKASLDTRFTVPICLSGSVLKDSVVQRWKTFELNFLVFSSATYPHILLLPAKTCFSLPLATERIPCLNQGESALLRGSTAAAAASGNLAHSVKSSVMDVSELV